MSRPVAYRWLLVAALLTPLALVGCDSVVKVTDSQRIQGKWKGRLGSFEFFSNGDFREYAALATHDGKWEILAGNRLKLTMKSRWVPDSEWRYELAGDNLTLTDMRGNVKLEYHRE